MQNTVNIYRIVKLPAKEADTISVSQLYPLHSPSMFLCLCLSELRCCLKKSARKKTIAGKMHDIFKASSGFISLYQYTSHSGYHLKSLACFKKEGLLRHLSSQMVHAKYSAESRALPFGLAYTLCLWHAWRHPVHHIIHLILLHLDCLTHRDMQLIRCWICIIPRGITDMSHI